MYTRLFAVALALSLPACAYVAPALPTAPTPIAAAPVAYVLELLPGPGPDYATGIGLIGVRARDIDGDIVDANVSCVPSAGVLLPARFSTRRATTELSGSTAITTVTCSSGELLARTAIDMSAWQVEFAANDVTDSQMNRVLLWPRQRIATLPATRLSLDWGDGTLEISATIPLSATPTMYHRYSTAGLFLAKARVDWPGGFVERQTTVRSAVMAGNTVQ